jgi:hypothetical protein
MVKNGFVRKKQRYLCKHCGKNNVDGDERLVHPASVQFQAVMMALNSVGHRSIGRILGIPYQYVAKWLKKYADIVAGKLKKEADQTAKTPTPIVELDELWTYVKKKPHTLGYGLLWIGSEVKLLILK